MELRRSGLTTLNQELKEESEWVESNLRRRRALRAQIESGQISFFVTNLGSKEPMLTIRLPEGGPNPFFVRVVNIEGGELHDPEGYFSVLGVEGLGYSQSLKDRLQKIASALPEFLDNFYTNARGIPIRIYKTPTDFRACEPLATINFPEGENQPQIIIDESKL